MNTLLHALKKKIFKLRESEKYHEKAYAKLVDEIDMQSFFEIMSMRGLYSLNNHEISTLFSDLHGVPAFSATMSK